MRERLQDVRRAAGVAAIVGPSLIAINHFDEVASGHWSVRMAVKAALTLLVPFVVSLHGATSARHQACAAARPARVLGAREG